MENEYINFKNKQKNDHNWHAIIEPHPFEPELGRVIIRCAPSKDEMKSFIDLNYPNMGYKYV